nr:hypothetical protein [Acinetobacter sp. Marseille-Q1620]
MDTLKIELLASAEWSRTNWELNCQPIIELDDLLPKVGESYDLILQGRESELTKEGVYSILWLPPHSELNGLECRPTEIEKSYIIKAQLVQKEWVKTSGLYTERKFLATILSVEKLFFLLNQVSEVQQDILKYYLSYDYYRIDYYNWEPYLLLSLRDEYIHRVFLFKNNKDTCNLIFLYDETSASYICELCNIKLSQKELKLLNRYITIQNKLEPEEHTPVAHHQIHGVAYI